jgi:hypothetical protein
MELNKKSVMSGFQTAPTGIKPGKDKLRAVETTNFLETTENRK